MEITKPMANTGRRVQWMSGCQLDHWLAIHSQSCNNGMRSRWFIEKHSEPIKSREGVQKFSVFREFRFVQGLLLFVFELPWFGLRSPFPPVFESLVALQPFVLEWPWQARFDLKHCRARWWFSSFWLPDQSRSFSVSKTPAIFSGSVVFVLGIVRLLASFLKFSSKWFSLKRCERFVLDLINWLIPFVLMCVFFVTPFLSQLSLKMPLFICRLRYEVTFDWLNRSIHLIGEKTSY